MGRLWYVRQHRGRTEQISRSSGIALTRNPTWPMTHNRTGCGVLLEQPFNLGLVKRSWWKMLSDGICPLYSVVWARWHGERSKIVFLFSLYSDHQFCFHMSLFNFVQPIIFKFFRCSTVKACAIWPNPNVVSFFAYALVEGLLILRVIHVSVFTIAIYTKTMFKW